MPIYSSQQRKQKYMIYIFLVVLIITLIVIYFGFLKDKINLSGLIPSLTPNIAVSGFRGNIDIDFSVIDSEEFQMLIPFDDAIPFSGKVGREQPFMPNK